MYTPNPFNIGLRIYKTGLAAFVCLVFSHALGGYPFFSVIAAIICMKPTIEDSLKVGLNRVFGTILGGFSGMAMLWLLTELSYDLNHLTYQIVTILGLMILIKLISTIGRHPATIITCVVYTSILLLPVSHGHTILQYSMLRILDTLLGVVVAVIVNELLPNYRYQEFIEQEKLLAEARQKLKEKAEADLRKQESIKAKRDKKHKNDQGENQDKGEQKEEKSINRE